MTRFLGILAASILAIPIALGGLAAKATESDIIATAEAAGSFKTLIEAVKAAGLEETLKGEGPFTVFAPTDEAFAKLPEGRLDALLKPENKAELVRLLSYHVISNKIMAADVAGKMSDLDTLQGSTVKVDSAGRVTKVDHAAVQQPDVMASNGVIHVIDKVISPK